MKIAICDDDNRVVNQLEALVLEAGSGRFESDAFFSGEELISYLEKSKEAYNIYFLDIEMPKINGIETAAAIRGQDKNAVIIFVTDHKEYVYDVFQVLPFRFLQKPVMKEVVLKVLGDAEEHLKTAGQVFFFQVGHEKHQIPYRDILFFEGAGRKVVIHSEREDWEFYGKMADVLGQLDTALFCRCHASYIVNMDALRSIQKTEAVLKNGQEIPVSKRQRETLRSAHLAYMERRGGIK